MALTIYIPPILFGRSMFLEVLNNPVSGKLLDWERAIADTEIWVAGRLHIVVSNERHYNDNSS